jgi:hypothetical protein
MLTMTEARNRWPLLTDTMRWRILGAYALANPEPRLALEPLKQGSSPSIPVKIVGGFKW